MKIILSFYLGIIRLKLVRLIIIFKHRGWGCGNDVDKIKAVQNCKKSKEM